MLLDQLACLDRDPFTPRLNLVLHTGSLRILNLKPGSRLCLLFDFNRIHFVFQKISREAHRGKSLPQPTSLIFDSSRWLDELKSQT